MKDNRKVVILIAVALFIVGGLVVMVVGRKDPAVLELPVSAPTETSVVENNQTENTQVPVDASEDTDPEPTVAEAAPELVIPAVKTGLESTNPATVNLTNGDIQLIEMFAFW